MAHPVDLTLAVLRIIQDPQPLPPPLIEGWLFFPGLSTRSYAEARAHLEGSDKPVMIAPLSEPGALAVWPLADLKSQEREQVERQLSTHRMFVENRLAELFPSGVDAVRLRARDIDLEIDIESFLGWLRDYYVAFGVTMVRGEEPRVAWLAVRSPGGKRGILGIPDSRSERRWHI